MIRVITFELTQHVRPRYIDVTDSRTDGQTDGRLTVVAIQRDARTMKTLHSLLLKRRDYLRHSLAFYCFLLYTSCFTIFFVNVIANDKCVTHGTTVTETRVKCMRLTEYQNSQLS